MSQIIMRGPGEPCCVPEWQLYRLGEESQGPRGRPGKLSPLRRRQGM
jgi:hypothetical protein